MRILLATAGLVIVSLCPAGCTSRLIKEGMGTVRGGRGVWANVRAVQGVAPLASYERFELQIADGFGQTPQEFFDLLPDSFAQELAQKGLPDNLNGKTLIIRGQVIHYETDGIIGLAFGDFEEVITRMELVDKSTGEVLGEANCIGRSKESVNRGVRTKAQGLAKAIASWIESGYRVPDDSDDSDGSVKNKMSKWMKSI